MDTDTKFYAQANTSTDIASAELDNESGGGEGRGTPRHRKMHALTPANLSNSQPKLGESNTHQPMIIFHVCSLRTTINHHQPRMQQFGQTFWLLFSKFEKTQKFNIIEAALRRSVVNNMYMTAT